ncbi:hypothetical protein CYLTODRAFT_363239 [Cylindrobasidium torrendii FP15055 ss-10]|uniref:Uncharacterized protein n=1 Tax=Cylindrobasidium torrendii FP15055 ss-10 TaxID=1314674 RepID=A0A0D7ASE0_9AGAR|nr:hypothetical protein CYLTODRAFT_363239 [Cylindrobasidium torrendii FP15055 ss-10]
MPPRPVTPPRPPSPSPGGGSNAPQPKLEHLLDAMAFAKLVREARLDDKYSGLHPDDIDAIRNPPEERLDIVDPTLRLSLDIFLALENTLEESYAAVRAAIQRYDPACEMFSYKQVLSRVKLLTGVVPIYHDMCINSCMAYTGIHAELSLCKHCGEPRWKPSAARDEDDPDPATNGLRVPRRQFATLLIAPQWQAMWHCHAISFTMKTY